jgi:hypothetical protein
MTVGKLGRGAPVHTVAELKRRHSRLDRSCKAAAGVLTKMQRGQSLNLSFERGKRRWLLSDGSSVSDEVAKIITVDHLASASAMPCSRTCRDRPGVMSRTRRRNTS